VTLAEYLEKQRSAIETELDRLAPRADERPQTLHRAMRHSLLARGKRLRPILFCAASEALGRTQGTLAPACALEFIHTYSLIHDDLPALDNDDFRRGQPTCHKAFGEATAILAGDALLTRAFQVLAETENAPPAMRIALIGELAAAAGTLDGMIGGQMEDLEAEGQPVEEARLHYIHRSKTGALIRAAVRMGGIFGEAASEELDRLSAYGSAIGTAFQIVDDILDVEGATESLGKTAGKDAEQQKATFPALYGLQRSKELAAEQLSLALTAVAPFGDAGRWLRGIAERIVSRSA
jgi:geranylgeranyl diphosphate synthase type II